jgi:hypothetical protein
MARVGLAGLALVLVVLLGAALVGPRLINLASLRERITAQLAQQLGAKVGCDSLSLSLLPRPAAVLRQLSVSIPGTIDMKIATVSASPRLLPLLQGKLQPAKVRIQAPEIIVHRLPLGPARADVATGLGTTVTSALGDVARLALSPVAGLAVSVHDGTLTLPLGEDGALQLRDVHAEIGLPPARLDIAVQCASSMWDRLSLRASIDPISADGSGWIEVTRLRPQLVAAPPLPAGLRLGDSEVNLALALSAHGVHTLQAELEGSIPALTVAHDRYQVVLRSPRLGATLTMDGEAWHATLTQLQLEYPRMQLSGRLSAAPGAAALDVQATDLEIDAARQVATLVAAEVPIVRDIFEVLHGGMVPEITVRSEAPSLGALGGGQALRIHGRLVDGRVHVPGVDLDLDHVTGEAAVAGGVLVGEQASAQLGKSAASGGRLRVGLGGSTPELHVDTQVQGDAAETAALLKRLVVDEAFQREFERVSDVGGSVTGRLSIDGTTSDVAVRAEASAFTVSAHIAGLRSPLQIDGEHFLYDARGIEARDVSLATGGSRLSEVAFRILPGRTRSFEAAAGVSRIALDEVYPWLQMSGWLPESPWNPTSVSGTLSLESLSLSRAPDDRGDWQFDLIGSAQRLVIESAQLQQRIATQYPVELSDLHVRYDTKTGTSLATKVTAPSNLSGALDLVSSAAHLEIKNLRVHDSQSDASLTLLLAPQDFSLTFKGRLTKATLDRLIENDLLAGSLRGDIHMGIGRNRPGRFTVKGQLEAQGVGVPLRGGRHVTIEDVALEGAGSRLSGKATVETPEGTHLQLQGQAQQSADTLVADVDLAAGRLDWSAIEPWLAQGDGAEGRGDSGSWAQSLRGKVRVTAEAFSYRGFTWEPVHAVMAFAPSAVTVTVRDATVCGVATPGTIVVAPQGLTLAFKPVAKNQPLQAVAKCMGLRDEVGTGLCSLDAEVSLRGTAAELSRSLQGRVNIAAANGRFYRMGVTARILSVLSVATGALGNIPQITEEGLPYDAVSIKGDLKGGRLLLKEATLDGPSVKWAAEGSVDLPAGSMDIILLVAPLTTVDAVVSRIPILSGVLGGSLVSIPVKVSGDFADPKITPLPPSAVGKGLLNVMKRTLKLPMKVIQPLLSDKLKR